MTNETSDEWIDKSFRYAVVGASADPAKYGHRVFKDLLRAGYDVVPVNPKGGSLLGVPVAPMLGEVRPLPDVVIFVTRPEIVAAVLPEARALGVTRFWFQPGTESDRSRTWCASAEAVECQFDRCVMVVRRAIEEKHRLVANH